MTINDYKLKYKLETYSASAGDTLKSVASVVYQSYNGRILDLLVAVNGVFNQWDELEPLTKISYINKMNINLITEIL